MEGRPWAEFRHGKEMTQTQLANLLRPFGTFPRTIRIGDETPKGYFRDQFEDAFARYLPASDPPQRHKAIHQPPHRRHVADLKVAIQPMKLAVVALWRMKLLWRAVKCMGSR
jgi:hypothetical protein